MPRLLIYHNAKIRFRRKRERRPVGGIFQDGDRAGSKLQLPGNEDKKSCTHKEIKISDSNNNLYTYIIGVAHLKCGTPCSCRKIAQLYAPEYDYNGNGYEYPLVQDLV